MKEHKKFIDSLKVGDCVYIEHRWPYGWNRGISYYVEDTITKITPKRTKFSFKNYSLEKDELSQIYPMSEELLYKNKVCENVKDIVKNLGIVNDKKTYLEDRIREKPLEELEEIKKLSARLNELMGG